jgi:hypothetical protein
MTILSVATNDENDFRRDMPLALAGSRHAPIYCCQFLLEG